MQALCQGLSAAASFIFRRLQLVSRGSRAVVVVFGQSGVVDNDRRLVKAPLLISTERATVWFEEAGNRRLQNLYVQPN
jgi:regulator of protease activity HflC (stomatin/prohibitin superfamily)